MATSGVDGGIGISRGTNGGDSDDDNNDVDDAERAASPGVLHSFIKHVKPFSVCFDTPAPASSSAGVRTNSAAGVAAASSVVPTRAAAEGAATATAATATATAPAVAGGEDDGEGGGDVNRADNLVDFGEGAGYYSPDHETPPARRETPASLTQHGETAATPASDVAPPHRGDTQGMDMIGGGGIGGSEALRRAKALLRGKRKLGSSSAPPARSDTAGSVPSHGESAAGANRNGADGTSGVDGGGAGAPATSPSANRMSKKTKTSSRAVGVAQGRAGRSSTGVSGRGGAGGKRGAGGSGSRNADHADRLSLSWGAAKRLRKRMEAAAAAEVRACRVSRVSIFMFGEIGKPVESTRRFEGSTRRLKTTLPVSSDSSAVFDNNPGSKNKISVFSCENTHRRQYQHASPAFADRGSRANRPRLRLAAAQAEVEAEATVVGARAEAPAGSPCPTRWR